MTIGSYFQDENEDSQTESETEDASSKTNNL